MFNVPNEYFMSSSPSPSNLIFNHSQHNPHYHSYNQVATSYYSSHSFDDNLSAQNYEHNIQAWSENDIEIDAHTG